MERSPQSEDAGATIARNIVSSHHLRNGNPDEAYAFYQSIPFSGTSSTANAEKIQALADIIRHLLDSGDDVKASRLIDELLEKGGFDDETLLCKSQGAVGIIRACIAKGDLEKASGLCSRLEGFRTDGAFLQNIAKAVQLLSLGYADANDFGKAASCFQSFFSYAGALDCAGVHGATAERLIEKMLSGGRQDEAAAMMEPLLGFAERGLCLDRLALAFGHFMEDMDPCAPYGGQGKSPGGEKGRRLDRLLARSAALLITHYSGSKMFDNAMEAFTDSGCIDAGGSHELVDAGFRLVEDLAEDGRTAEAGLVFSKMRLLHGDVPAGPGHFKALEALAAAYKKAKEFKKAERLLRAAYRGKGRLPADSKP
jgi:tetratricopeptide (TPR) repeat protein